MLLASVERGFEKSRHGLAVEPCLRSVVVCRPGADSTGLLSVIRYARSLFFRTALFKGEATGMRPAGVISLWCSVKIGAPTRLDLGAVGRTRHGDATILITLQAITVVYRTSSSEHFNRQPLSCLLYSSYPRHDHDSERDLAR